jgi:hypothetical protein
MQARLAQRLVALPGIPCLVSNVALEYYVVCVSSIMLFVCRVLVSSHAIVHGDVCSRADVEGCRALFDQWQPDMTLERTYPEVLSWHSCRGEVDAARV